MKLEYVNINDLKPYLNNAKIHTAEQVEQIKKSIEEFGMNDPIAIDQNNEIIEGHGRLLALQELGYEQVPIIRLEHLTEEQKKAYTLVHNKLTMNTGFDIDLLRLELDDIFDIDMSDFGFFDDNEVLDLELEEQKGSMADKYLVPPFSVIHANKPDWLARKRAWVEKGLRSELGRGGICLQ